MSSGLVADVDVSAVELRKRVPSASSEDMKVMPESNADALVQAKKEEDSHGSFDGKVRPKGENGPKAANGQSSKRSGKSGGANGKTSPLQEKNIDDHDIKVASFDPKRVPRTRPRKSLIDPSMNVNQLGPTNERRGSNAIEMSRKRRMSLSLLSAKQMPKAKEVTLMEKAQDWLENARRRISIDELVREYSLNEDDEDHVVFRPDGLIYFCWLIIILAASVYTVVEVPLRAAFSPSEWDYAAFGIPQYAPVAVAVDAIFILDIYLRLFHFGVHVRGSVAIYRELFQVIYITSWFVLDAITAIPLTSVSVLVVNSGVSLRRAAGIFKLFRIFRVVSYYFELEEFFSTNSLLSGNGAARRIRMLLLTLVTFCFFMGCVFFQLNTDGSTANNTVNRFIQSLYFLFQTVMTVGYGDITVRPDANTAWFVCLLMLSGTFIHASVISVMISFVINNNVTQDRHEAKVSTVKKVLRILNAPAHIHREVTSYFHVAWERQKGARESELLNDIPVTLKDELLKKSEGVMKVIKAIPVFKDCPRDFFERIAEQVKPLLVCAGEKLVSKNGNKQEMWLLANGVLNVIAPIRKNPKLVVAQLRSGDFYGEYVLFSHGVSKFTVVAQTVCDIYELKKESVESILKLEQFAHLRYITDGMSSKHPVMQDAVDFHIKREQEWAKLGKSGTSCSTVEDGESEDDTIIAKLQDSHYRFAWDVIVVLIVIYLTIVVPMRIAFFETPASSISTSLGGKDIYYGKVFEPIFQIMVLVDFYFLPKVKLRTQPVAKDWSIWSKFSQRTVMLLVLDMCIFGSILANLVVGACCGDQLWSLISLVACRFVFFLPGYIEKIKIHVQNLTGYNLPASTFLMVKILTMLLAASHLLTCSWAVIKAQPYSEQLVNNSYVNGTVTASTTYTVLRPGKQIKYLESIYYIFMTITTIGFGDIVPNPSVDAELVFGIFAMVFGVALYSGIVSVFANISHNADVSEDNFENMQTCLNHYMADRNFPKELRTKCIDFSKYVWSEREGLSIENVIKSDLPEMFQNDLKCSISDKRISESQLFGGKDCDKSLRRRIAEVMTTHTFCPGDTIISSKSFLRKCMIIVKKGKGTMYASADANESFSMSESKGSGRNQKKRKKGRTGGRQKIKDVLDGDSFGEESLFSDVPLEIEIEAEDFTEVLALHKSEMENVLRDFPKMPLILKEKAKAIGRKTSANQFMKNMNSKKLEAMMATNQDSGMSASRILFHPDSKEMLIWSTAVWVFIVWNIIAIPIRIAFYTEMNASFVFDYVGDIVFLIDIGLRLFYLGVEGDSGVVMNPDAAQKMYLQGAFVFHLLAWLPLDVFALAFSAFGEPGRWVALFRTFKLLRIHTPTPAYERRLAHSGRSMLRLVQLVMLIVLAANLLGCLFYAVALGEEQRLNSGGTLIPGNSTTNNGTGGAMVDGSSPPLTWAAAVSWIDDGTGEKQQNLVDAPGRQETKWIRSIYWAVTLLTAVGYGDIFPISEAGIFFTTFFMLLGGAIYAYILSSLEEIIAQADISSIIFQRKKEELVDYGEYRQIETKMKGRLSDFLNMLWQRNRGITEKKLLEFLPCSLRAKVILYNARDPFKKVFFIKDWDCAESLALLLEPQMIPEEELIFVKGMVAKNLYFVGSRGKVDYKDIPEDGPEEAKTIKSYMSGDCFGESPFFLRELYPCNAFTAEMSDIYVMPRDSFDAFLERNKDYKRDFDEKLPLLEAELRKRDDLGALSKNLRNSKLQKFGFSNEDMGEKSKGWVELPGSTFRMVWNLVFILAFVYVLVSVPYRVAFEDRPYPGVVLADPWIVFDIIVDLLFFADIYLHAFHFAVEKDGAMLKRQEEFFQHYLHTLMVPDVLASLPIDYVILAAVANNVSVVALARVGKYLRILHLSPISAALSHWLDENTSNFRSNYRKLILIVSAMVLLVHTSACIRACIDRAQGIDTSTNEGDSQNLTAYVRYLYWSMYTMTTIGYGNGPGTDIQTYTNGQALFSMVVMVVGAFLSHAGITAVLTNLIKNFDDKMGHMITFLESFDTYMESRNVPRKLRDRINEYYEFKQAKQMNLNEQDILESLPEGIRIDVMRHVAWDIQPGLDDNVLFKEISTPGMIDSLILALKKSTVMADVPLIQKGKPPKKFYFIVRGQVVVTDERGRAFNKTEGVIGSLHTNYSAITITVCEFFELNIMDYRRIMCYTMQVGGIYQTFDELLNDPPGARNLMAFAESQFSSENLSFWNDVEKFKQIHWKKTDEIEKHAKAIFEKYVPIEAARTINIDDHTRKELESNIQVPSLKIFDSAQQIIYKNMLRDLLPRFIKSPFFERLCEEKSRSHNRALSKGHSSSISKSISGLGGAYRKRRMSIGELSLDQSAIERLQSSIGKNTDIEGLSLGSRRHSPEKKISLKSVFTDVKKMSKSLVFFSSRGDTTASTEEVAPRSTSMPTLPNPEEGEDETALTDRERGASAVAGAAANENT